MTSRTKLKRKEIDDVLGTQDFGTDETDGKHNICIIRVALTEHDILDV